MRRSLIVQLALLTALVSACGPSPITSESPSGAPPASTPARISVPAGFPIPPEASPVAMQDDDPGLIALWTAEAHGSTIYDFFLLALPAAGYPITQVSAGDTVAQFLFSAPSGAGLQLDLYTNADLTTRIELRLPRP